MATEKAIELFGVRYTEKQLLWLLGKGYTLIAHPGSLPNHACRTFSETRHLVLYRNGKFLSKEQGLCSIPLTLQREFNTAQNILEG